LDVAKKIIETNEFYNIDSLDCSKAIKDFINRYYHITCEDINNPSSKIYKEKKEYDLKKKLNQ
jgi:hypothetical protein